MFNSVFTDNSQQFPAIWKTSWSPPTNTGTIYINNCLCLSIHTAGKKWSKSDLFLQRYITCVTRKNTLNLTFSIAICATFICGTDIQCISDMWQCDLRLNRRIRINTTFTSVHQSIFHASRKVRWRITARENFGGGILR